jgi:hypothetical protein
MKPAIQVVESGMDALNAVRELNQRGFGQADIYVLAHDGDQTDSLADATDTNKIGMQEEGVLNTMANLFRSRGDELRSKLESIGFTSKEADHYEQELDQGRVLVITKK